jgi:hypothetical protein
MRKLLFIVLSLAILAPLGSLALAGGDWEETIFTPSYGFTHEPIGKRIAGVWLGTFTIPVPPDPLVIAFVTTFNEDGTAQTSSTNPLASLHHMTWEQTGLREITWRILHFTMDADGALASISRTWGVQEFDRAYEEYTGEFAIEICPAPGLTIDESLELLLADPNDPDACFNPPLVSTLTAKRLHVDAP